MRKTLAVVVALAIAAPLAAQQQAGKADPTNKVKGSGTLPAGWMMRYDPTRPGQPTPAANEVNFVTMGSGFHFTSGPAAIYYNPKDMMAGTYTVTASLTQTKAPTHPEAYGIFVGGQSLQDS